MPRKSSVPSYRLHKASGQARTIVNGRHIYLGKYGSPESREQYARILAEAVLPAGTPSPNRFDSQRLLVSELLVAYLKFAETYYSDEGQPTKEFQSMVDAVGPLNNSTATRRPMNSDLSNSRLFVSTSSNKDSAVLRRTNALDGSSGSSNGPSVRN